MTATHRLAPPSREHDLPVLDAYRAVAALLVLLANVGHQRRRADRPVGRWLAGWMRPAVFFLLSGLLLFRAWVRASSGAQSPVRIGGYFVRRAVRILPALLLVVAAAVLLLPAARRAGWPAWTATVLGAQNYFRSTFGQLPGLSQTWSLSVEVAFYLLLPLIALIALGRGRRAARRSARQSDRRSGLRVPVVLGVLVLASIGWRLVVAGRPGVDIRPLLWLPAYLDWFAAGMLLGWLLERDRPVPRAVRYVAGTTGACWSVALCLVWLSIVR
jgi:peptidoglycan/LPS O-acetylase OafA/YrhL